MCWIGPFEFRWLKEYIHNPTYYHHQIGRIHLSHCCPIFFCVLDGCTIIFCHLLHIYPGNIGTTPSHYHRYADLSEGIELLKCLSGICCRVCLRLRQFSQLSLIQYIGLCVFSLPNSSVMIVRMCTWSYYHHQTRSMTTTYHICSRRSLVADLAISCIKSSQMAALRVSTGIPYWCLPVHRVIWFVMLHSTGHWIQ